MARSSATPPPKVEWHPGELYPRVGFIVTNLSRPAERVVVFYNKRGTCEQWIKEGKGAIKWSRSPFSPLIWSKPPWKVACRAGSELPVSAMPRPSGRVSTGCSASPVLSLRKLYLTQWCAPAPRARSKLIGRYGALLPLFRLVGVPCIAAFGRVKSLLCHHSDRPKLANRSVGYFAGATSLTGVSSALVFSPCLLASSRSRSISPARRSCTTRVSSAFFRSSKIL